MINPSQSAAGLSLAEKRVLLAQLLRERATQAQSQFPLTHGQRGLWFLQQMDRSSAAYNMCLPIRMRSRLDRVAFRRALQTIVDRHSSFRTTFEERDGALLQRVHEQLPVHLDVIDVSSWDEQVLRSRLQEEALRPFDLQRGPLVRIHLFSRAADDHICLFMLHHIIGDFLSLVLVTEEMRTLYPAFQQGTVPALPPLPTQYRDYVRWQGELLAGREGERLWTYWERQLAGVTPVLELPADRPRPPRFTHQGSAVPCRIDAELTRRLKSLAAGERVTLYTVLLTTFQVLLARTTGQEDFVVGSSFAGRSRSEFERVVGHFSNMLPLRAKLSGNPTFGGVLIREGEAPAEPPVTARQEPRPPELGHYPTFRSLLRQVGATILEGLQHQDYPFALMVERLNLKRDPSRTPLVQVTFTLEKSHRHAEGSASSFLLAQASARLNMDGMQMEAFALEHRICKCDLELLLQEGDGSIEGVLIYNTDLFDADTISRLAGHFHTLLQAAVDHPDRPWTQMPWLEETERRRVVQEWNQTRADYPGDLCLHQLFERQAERAPAAVALRFGERTLSYAELDAWANRLAERLREAGVGRGALVALCLERSPEMVAAMLATLKVGGAYVPLDPDSPADRLRVMLADTRAPVVLTQPHLGDRLPQEVVGSGQWAVGSESMGRDDSDLCLLLTAHCPLPTAHCPLPTAHCPLPTAHCPLPTDLAYVIYTSGSTGRPKGVMVEHRAVCNTVQWRQQALTLNAGDRVLLTFPYFFDPSVCIIFPTLAAGAQLVLPEAGEERDPARLRQRVARDAVTVLQLLPRVLRLFLAGPLDECRRTLRCIVCGGEVMPPELSVQVHAGLDVDFYNLYGPTEAAVDTTAWQCRRGDSRAVIPIGRPIANVQVYVLDSDRQPVPVGVPGELFIGGAGLARGYLNDPDLTAERFIPIADCGLRIADSAEQSAIPNPQSAIDRLYRTGDRCRWLADGNLEFLGRLDQQVKVRGYRIEVGEIEAALTAHPAVAEAAVAVQTDTAGEQRLVAYVVGSQPEMRADPLDLDWEGLRRHLKERLPAYMVPAACVKLAALPRTASGKLDRRALPAGIPERPRSGKPFVAPQTPLEEFLADLWRDMLGVDQVSVEDHFFDLGGNSLQGALMLTRLQERLGHDVFTVALFDSPTIRSLAHYLEETYPESIGRRFGPRTVGSGQWAVGSEQKAVDSKQGSEPSGPTDSLPTAHCPLPTLLVPLQPEGSRPPFFMVHPPGGIVVCYQPLAHHLGDDQPVYGIRSRGLHGEPDLPTSLAGMAADYVAAIRQLQSEGPYYLGGWSLGGVVAYEMAQQLTAQGQAIGLLALLDTTLPFGRDNPNQATEADRSGQEYGLDVALEELAQLGPDEQLPYLWEHARKLGLVESNSPLPVVKQILDDLKRLFHVHVLLASEYVVRPYPGRITLFRPSETPVQVPTLPDRGWGRFAAGVDVHFVPGQHHSMVQEPHAQVLAQQLRLCLPVDR